MSDDQQPEMVSNISLPEDGSKPEQIVLMLHGVGADGQDLLGFAPYLRRALPKAAFVSPDAPFPFDGAPFGRQWFSLMDPSKEAKWEGVQTAAPLLDDYIDRLLVENEMEDSQLALLGFSQGTMMALHVGLRRPKPLAGILGYSGALIGDEMLASQIQSRPPVLLVHGDADAIVPPEMLEFSCNALVQNDVQVWGHMRPGLGHGLDDHCVMLGMSFLADVFGVDLVQVQQDYKGEA